MTGESTDADFFRYIEMNVKNENRQAEKKKLYPAIIAAVIFVCIASGIQGFIMLAALGLIPFLLWVIVSIVHAIVIPDMRKFLLARVLIWIVAIAVVFGIFEIKHKIMRGYADEVVEKVKVYYAAHGHYPKTLAEIGIEQQKFKETLGRRSGYLCMGDAPHLFYTAPIDGFDTWFYDFAGNEWGFHPD